MPRGYGGYLCRAARLDHRMPSERGRLRRGIPIRGTGIVMQRVQMRGHQARSLALHGNERHDLFVELSRFGEILELGQNSGRNFLGLCH